MYIIKNNRLGNFFQATHKYGNHFVSYFSEAKRFRKKRDAEDRLSSMEKLREYRNMEVVKI